MLVDFWTYTCINWLRTLPYVRAWAERYRDQGLVVIGVHTPEFAFEKDIDNVRTAVRSMAIEYPVAIDSDYGVWRAFANHYWPALYFADARGRLRHHQFGEGEYEQSEMVIQQLLAEAGLGDVDDDLVSVEPHGVEVAADWGNLESPENYVGYGRTESFASPGGAVLSQRRDYLAPPQLSLNQWALTGEWTVEGEFVGVERARRGDRLPLSRPRSPSRHGTGDAGWLRAVSRADRWASHPGTAHGADVDGEGNGTVTEQRLYQLIRQRGPIADHTFEIAFLDAGVRAYAFTFG